MLNLPSFLSSPPRVEYPVARSVFLALLVGVQAWHLTWMGQHRWAFESDRHRIFAFVVFALLLNHLAFRFTWPWPAAALLRIVATLWLGALACYWVAAMYS